MQVVAFYSLCVLRKLFDDLFEVLIMKGELLCFLKLSGFVLRGKLLKIPAYLWDSIGYVLVFILEEYFVFAVNLYFPVLIVEVGNGLIFKITNVKHVWYHGEIIEVSDYWTYKINIPVKKNYCQIVCFLVPFVWQSSHLILLCNHTVLKTF